jgi:type IV fimbrial biogenesis protein FimT
VLGALTMKRRGFTLIELMIALGVMGILVAIAGPAMYDFILIQRLRSINSQLVTDLQFARSEAATYSNYTYVRFNEVAGSLSCYAVYTGTAAAGCNCTRATMCTASAKELRSVVLPADSKLRLRHANGTGEESFALTLKMGR